MKVKGSVVKTISNFVQATHPSGYRAWLDNLPKPCQSIYQQAILATEWFPVREAVILPTELIATMFYDDTREAAWASGYFSAAQALTDMYKIFMLINKPAYLISKANRVLASFYAPSQLYVIESGNQNMVIHITEFPVPNAIIEYRIAGWMQKALEMCGCRDLRIDLTLAMSKGDKVTEYTIHWR